MSVTVTITGCPAKLAEATRAAGCVVYETQLPRARKHYSVHLHDRLVGHVVPDLHGYNGVLTVDTAYLGMAGVVLLTTALVGEPGFG